MSQRSAGKARPVWVHVLAIPVFLWSLNCAYAAVLLENPVAGAAKTFQAGDLIIDGPPTELYDHGDPSPEAQYLLELVNRARANPALEGRLLADVEDADILRAYRSYNVDMEAIVEEFSQYSPQPPLAFNAALIEAATVHALDMRKNDFQDHYGSEGSSPADRIVDAGYFYSLAGENAYAYAYSLDYCHAGFLVDWGVDSLGHRNNLLNIDGRARFREIGIAVVEDHDLLSRVGPLIVTQEFGRRLNDLYVFITGVVYSDKNGNGFYDVGEGISGVTIKPNRGQYYAVSSTSGGYTIPVVKDSGEYQITAVGENFEAAATVSVQFENVKLDFVVDRSDPAGRAAAGDYVLAGHTEASVDQHQDPSSEDYGLMSDLSSAICPIVATALLTGILLLGYLPQRRW